MSVERFDPQIAGATDEGFLPMDEAVEGEWVRFEDYEALRDGVEKEIERLRQRHDQKLASIIANIGAEDAIVADRLQLLLDDSEGGSDQRTVCSNCDGIEPATCPFCEDGTEPLATSGEGG